MLAASQAIREARESIGLSLPAVAEKAMLTTDVLLSYEAGDRELPGHVLWRLSDILGVPFEEIDTRTDLERHLRALRVRFKSDSPDVSEAVRFAVARAAAAARQYVELESVAGRPSRYAALLGRFPEPPDPPTWRTWLAGQEFAKAFRHETGLNGPVKSVLEVVAKIGVLVLWQKLPKQIAGFALCDELHGPTVVVNVNGRNANELTRRFTLLHETCHVIYDRDHLERMDSFDLYSDFYDYVSASRDAREIRANAFAIHVLAPEDLLRAAWRSEDEPHDAVRSLMVTLGISYEAARCHLANYSMLPFQEQLAQRVAAHAPDEFKAEGRELWYPAFDSIPIERRHSVAELAFDLWRQGRITESSLRDVLGASLPYDELTSLAELYPAGEAAAE